ncbi:hypothetical protein HD806DRAFT_529296 [Xylariaceae sp. AK1471]|nr:hypothetical protein HD806DRAFT_529296 [Xylariaceae sp. AK1471]
MSYKHDEPPAYSQGGPQAPQAAHHNQQQPFNGDPNYPGYASGQNMGYHQQQQPPFPHQGGYPPQQGGYYPPQQGGYYPPQQGGHYPPQHGAAGGAAGGGCLGALFGVCARRSGEMISTFRRKKKESPGYLEDASCFAHNVCIKADSVDQQPRLASCERIRKLSLGFVAILRTTRNTGKRCV